MYWDSRGKRLLLRDGRSFCEESEYARRLINNEPVDGLLVEDGHGARAYSLIFDESISDTIEPIQEPSPSPEMISDDELMVLVEELKATSRYEEDPENELRLLTELDFFWRTGNIGFLYRLRELIESFREKNIVWGVGRGSSCGSYVMFLLEVNDINPLLYDIPFSEMSKEQEFEDD